MPFKDLNVRRLYANEWMKKYRQRPDVKERIRRYSKDYHQRLEVKERVRLYNQRPAVKLHCREYAQRPDVKEKRRLIARAYRQRPYARERNRRYMKAYAHSRHHEDYLQRPEVKAQRRRWENKYRQRPEVKERRRDQYQRYGKEQKIEYSQRPEIKDRKRQRMREYLRRPAVKERLRDRLKERSQLPDFKLRCIGYRVKHRGKGFIPLCPNFWSCPVDYHHVSPSHPYVVPLPRSVHRAVGGNSPTHFAFNASMTFLLYGLDIVLENPAGFSLPSSSSGEGG